jgi:hypothetical protein
MVLKVVKKLLILLGEFVRIIDYQDWRLPILMLVPDGVTGKNSQTLF